MRYKLVIYPLLDQTLAVVTTSFDDRFSNGSVYDRTLTLKTKGPDWDLPGFLREIADRLDAAQF